MPCLDFECWVDKGAKGEDPVCVPQEANVPQIYYLHQLNPALEKHANLHPRASMNCQSEFEQPGVVRVVFYVLFLQDNTRWTVAGSSSS